MKELLRCLLSTRFQHVFSNTCGPIPLDTLLRQGLHRAGRRVRDRTQLESSRTSYFPHCFTENSLQMEVRQGPMSSSHQPLIVNRIRVSFEISEAIQLQCHASQLFCISQAGYSAESARTFEGNFPPLCLLHIHRHFHSLCYILLYSKLHLLVSRFFRKLSYPTICM